MNRARDPGLTAFMSLRPRSGVALAVFAALSGGAYAADADQNEGELQSVTEE